MNWELLKQRNPTLNNFFNKHNQSGGGKQEFNKTMNWELLKKGIHHLIIFFMEIY